MLLDYQPSRSYRYIDYGGDQHHWSVPVREHPWWSAYAAIALIVVGAAIADRLVPEARLLVRREGRRLRRAAVAHLQALRRRAVVR